MGASQSPLILLDVDAAALVLQPTDPLHRTVMGYVETGHRHHGVAVTVLAWLETVTTAIPDGDPFARFGIAALPLTAEVAFSAAAVTTSTGLEPAKAQLVVEAHRRPGSVVLTTDRQIAGALASSPATVMDLRTSRRT